MITIQDVLNDRNANNRSVSTKIHPFESVISPYVAWGFIVLNISPNAITLLFLLIGINSCILFPSSNILISLFAFVLYRIHILLDLVDGDVARFTKKTSIHGKYLDLFAHQIIYPLLLSSFIYYIYTQINNFNILLFSIFLAILTSFRLSINSIVYRVNYFNKDYMPSVEAPASLSPKKFNLKKIKLIFAKICGFNIAVWLFILTRVLYLFTESYFILIVFMFYIIITQILYVLAKLYFVLRYNQIPRRESLY